jgi:hypothetical protein
MIIAVIYFIHAIFAVYIFARSYQSEGWLQAFLNIGFVIILFSVSLTVCEIFTGLVISENGYSFTAPTSPVLMFLMKISGFYAQDRKNSNPDSQRQRYTYLRYDDRISFSTNFTSAN